MVFDEGPLPAEGEQPESSDQEPGQPITNSPSSSREGKVDAGAKTGGGREEVPSLSLPSLSQKALPVVANLGAPGTRPDSQGSNASGWETAREHLPEIIDSGRKEKEDERKQAEALKRQKKLRLDHGRAKKTPKRQMDAHLDELVALMNQEWTQIAKMATSLKSGTGVVEEALLRKLHITIRKINLLCLKNNEAAEHMIYRVKRFAALFRPLAGVNLFLPHSAAISLCPFAPLRVRFSLPMLAKTCLLQPRRPTLPHVLAKHACAALLSTRRFSRTSSCYPVPGWQTRRCSSL